MITKISRDELRAKLERGAPLVIVEALPPAYYEDAHLPRALNLPHDRVDELAPALLPDKQAEIVAYCSNGQCPNSHAAAGRLAKLGYTNVRVYAEGKQDWIEAGLPIERSASSVVR